MGGFSAQVQPNQSSAPASKGAGMRADQMGQNPIQQSFPQKLETSLMQAQGNEGAIDPTQPSYGGQSVGTGPQANGMLDSTGMMGGTVTMPGQGGQPQLGMPNAYSNTISPWDNSINQPKQGSGKGKGA
jgi:hypothetical protein